MQKRIQYLDIIKVISIFLVVFCHFVLLAETIPANIFMVACWSGVPMFFMVNGALLFTRPEPAKTHPQNPSYLHSARTLETDLPLFHRRPVPGTSG